MTIKLIIEPGKIYSWDEFRQQKPPYSIALDGFVDEPTQRDRFGPYANLDHHRGVDRYSTKCASAQVFSEMVQGLFNTFQINGEPHANIYINHCDEDSILAVWLFQNYQEVLHPENNLIDKLVDAEDKLDGTAGAYPIRKNLRMRQTMAWIYEPYNVIRFENKNKLMDLTVENMLAIIASVSERISKYVEGNAKELPLKGQYEVIGGGPGWAFIKETGPDSRLALYEDGIDAFIALMSESDGWYQYCMAKRSSWIEHPQQELYDAFNRYEGRIITPKNCWGGNDTTGGSPKKTGSSMDPKKVEEITNEVVVESRQKLHLRIPHIIIS